MAMNEAREKSKEIIGVENSTNDITDDWTEVCKTWFDLVETLKVQGRKGKLYEQAMIRTMFWKRTGDETFTQNGVKYIISNAANQDTYACRGLIYEIWQLLSADRIEELNFDNYLQWRKELVAKLKDWEKKYHKHAKTINPEMNDIHMRCMRPLCDMMESNFNLYNFKELQKKKKEELPEFRGLALEEKYILHFTKLCDILKEYGKL